MSVNRPKLGCLGNADHTRFVRMNFRLTRDHSIRLIDVDLAGVTANQKQL